MIQSLRAVNRARILIPSLWSVPQTSAYKKRNCGELI